MCGVVGRHLTEFPIFVRPGTDSGCQQPIMKSLLCLSEKTEFSGEGLRSHGDVLCERCCRRIEIVSGRLEAWITLEETNDVYKEDSEIADLRIRAVLSERFYDLLNSSKPLIDLLGERFVGHAVTSRKKPSRIMAATSKSMLLHG